MPVIKLQNVYTMLAMRWIDSISRLNTATNQMHQFVVDIYWLNFWFRRFPQVTDRQTDDEKERHLSQLSNKKEMHKNRKSLTIDLKSIGVLILCCLISIRLFFLAFNNYFEIRCEHLWKKAQAHTDTRT